jgi:hypothetical protein
MSNKTIFKRISLVVITALGAGVLSVAPASAADNPAVGNATNAVSAAGFLNVATFAATLGDGVTSATTADNQSLGLLANSTTLGLSSLTNTATIAATGEIVFYTTTPAASTTDSMVSIVVTGGTINENVTTNAGAGEVLLSQDNTLIVAGKDDDGSDVISVGIVPNSGATSMTVSMYTTTLTAAEDAAAGMAAALAEIISGARSKGTLSQRYLVTVAATSTSGVFSAGDSYIAGATNATANDGGTTNVDAADSLSIASQTVPYAYININLRDAYDVSLDGGKGALIITGTNGAAIAYKADGTAASTASDFNLTQVSNTSAAGKITVAKPTALVNKAFSTTISISWNGVVVGTKAVVFLGEVASMTVTPRRIGATKQTIANTDAFRVKYADSAGNTLTGASLGVTSVIASTTTSVVTGASIGTAATSTDDAKGTITCAAGASDYLLAGGKASLQLQHVNPISGTTVKSNVFAAECQGNAYSYTAGFDKTSYTPGSIATLTITLKDRDGDLANGYDTWAATNVATITGGPSATAVAIPVVGDQATSGTGLQGIKTYQFIVGSTEGDFQAVVSLADVNSRNSSQTNQTVAYSVKSSTSTVSNADVLKSIVALIASINKQIQALQKLILARR